MYNNFYKEKDSVKKKKPSNINLKIKCKVHGVPFRKITSVILNCMEKKITTTLLAPRLHSSIQALPFCIIICKTAVFR